RVVVQSLAEGDAEQEQEEGQADTDAPPDRLPAAAATAAFLALDRRESRHGVETTAPRWSGGEGWAWAGERVRGQPGVAARSETVSRTQSSASAYRAARSSSVNVWPTRFRSSSVTTSSCRLRRSATTRSRDKS